MTMFELLNCQLLVRTSLSKDSGAVVLGLSLYKLLFKEKRDLGECSVHNLRGPWISRRKKEWSNQNNNAVQWVFYWYLIGIQLLKVARGKSSLQAPKSNCLSSYKTHRSCRIFMLFLSSFWLPCLLSDPSVYPPVLLQNPQVL